MTDLDDITSDPTTIRVLITGFGPFQRYNVNPSWLSVKPLHNTILYTQPSTIPQPSASSESDTTGDAMDIPPDEPRRIHITALEVPVSYPAVLSVVPQIHGRPPYVPRPSDPAMNILPPPVNGYDFVFHVGVAGRGGLRIEKLAHKFGFRMKDGDGSYAPTVVLPKEDHVIEELSLIPGLTFAEPTPNPVEAAEANPNDGQPNRGFGEGYKNYSDELYTDIDVARLINYLKENGVEQVYSSMDAGHYLTDFIFYCSLAESRRHIPKGEKESPTKSIPVLAMHCGPVDQPLSTDEVTEAIKKIVMWVCQTSL
ncbi:peptidase C15 pyroglutamyl peptidase I-like protein [Abortiporus biennis]|nr:peptidase C15 pyroglutamyl peptidase I-like protein [Abortiporus biennis]